MHVAFTTRANVGTFVSVPSVRSSCGQRRRVKYGFHQELRCCKSIRSDKFLNSDQRNNAPPTAPAARLPVPPEAVSTGLRERVVCIGGTLGALAYSLLCPIALALDVETSVLAIQDLPPIPTTFPELRALKLPEYKQVTLNNGTRLFLLEDHELGMIHGTVLMKGGSRAEAADKVAVASVGAAIQRSGGTPAHPGAALDVLLEDLAAAIEVGSGPGTMSASFVGLAEDAPQLVSLTAEVVRQPAFPSDKLELTRARLLNALEHRNDDISGIPRRELLKVVYGKDSVYARTPTVAGAQ
ncbi:hypothetical protein CYMTET_33660 [Cymbomonas tetramitiformis]|uniref:Uncharacterized protein n=1 Tax=Cymbomonas tetramitiformis TaxID=36881 RepID=A0AAE0FCQ8_9CHLO|nr:hypothetical protein CYMTET_33660 [Cymbomonas tetramitiformis]